MICGLRPLLGMALGACLSVSVAQAGSLVEFPTVSGNGIPAHLLGYLARPDGDGPFPAVVVLHGCAGFSSGGSLQLADELKDWGYVALTVDSLGPRGLATACGGPFIDQPGDAYAALHYLSQQAFVAPERVAVLGNSMGGYSALYAVDGGLMTRYFQDFKERFHAAVAYYPSCGIPATTMTAPSLILIGDADDWNSADRCRHMIAHARPDSAPIELVVYPGAHHGFNFAMLQPGRSSLGHWLEYNEPAAKDAEAKVRAFLAANLAGAAPAKPATQ
ncbi:MAG: dienelactone hydrolase family protein [Alphaproteobacteria bacterium]|nr:dienelactone hydrolase family protein [Alphaproteobacteria bacterium]